MDVYLIKMQACQGGDVNDTFVTCQDGLFG